MFEYESTNWATGPQAQGTDEFDDCFCAGRGLIVSNDGKHDWVTGRKGKVFVRSKIWSSYEVAAEKEWEGRLAVNDVGRTTYTMKKVE